jgi:hypothetical protein
MDFEEGAKIVSHCYAATVRNRADEQRLFFVLRRGGN